MGNYLLIILRTIVGYSFLFVLMKIMGKREIGQLSLFDLIIILSIADIMVVGIDQFDTDLLYTFIPMLIVALLQKIIALLSLKSKAIRTFFDGNESYIVIDSKINLKEMKKQRYNMDDLYSQLRNQGIKAIMEVDYAVLEASGKLSVFKKDQEFDVSFPVIISGKINDVALKMAGYGKQWLEQELKNQKIELKDVLGANVYQGKLEIVKTIKI